MYQKISEKYKGYDYSTLDHTDNVWQSTIKGIKEQGDLNTLSCYTMVCTRKGALPEGIQYRIAKAMNEQKEKIWETYPSMKLTYTPYNAAVKYRWGPLTPGARRYYKEIGALEK